MFTVCGNGDFVNFIVFGVMVTGRSSRVLREGGSEVLILEGDS